MAAVHTKEELIQTCICSAEAGVLQVSSLSHIAEVSFRHPPLTWQPSMFCSLCDNPYSRLRYAEDLLHQTLHLITDHLKLNIWREQVWPIARQIKPIRYEVLRSLLCFCSAYQHCSLHNPITKVLMIASSLGEIVTPAYCCGPSTFLCQRQARQHALTAQQKSAILGQPAEAWMNRLQWTTRLTQVLNIARGAGMLETV